MEIANHTAVLQRRDYYNQKGFANITGQSAATPWNTDLLRLINIQNTAHLHQPLHCTFSIKQGFGEFTTNPPLSQPQINYRIVSFHIFQTGQTLPLNSQHTNEDFPNKVDWNNQGRGLANLCPPLFVFLRHSVGRGREQHPTKHSNVRSDHNSDCSEGDSQGTGSAVVHAFTNTLPALFTLCWGSFIFPSLQQKKILSLHGQLDSASTEEKQSQKQQLFQWTAVLYSEGLRSSYAGKHFLQGEKKFRVTINIAQLIIIIIIGSSLNQRKEDRTPTATYIQRNEHRKIKGKIVLHEAWAHCSDKAWTTMDVCQLTSELVNTILKRQRKRILYYAGYTNHKYLVLRFSASPSQG